MEQFSYVLLNLFLTSSELFDLHPDLGALDVFCRMLLSLNELTSQLMHRQGVLGFGKRLPSFVYIAKTNSFFLMKFFCDFKIALSGS